MAVYYPDHLSAFEDPLAGTGYTTEQARALVSRQRRLVNAIRKRRRNVEMLKAAALDAGTEIAKLRALQAQLSKLAKGI